MILSGSNAAQKIYLTHVKFLHVHEIKLKQANRGDMRKIHVTRQFFEASGPQGLFLKNAFLDKVYGSMCTKFQFCIVFRLARRRDTHTKINKYTHIQVNLGISSTGCSPHVDFDK